MEVSRLASRFGLEPPGLVQMEKEIDAEEAREQNDGPDTKISTPNIRHRFVFYTKTEKPIAIIIIYRTNVTAQPAQYQWLSGR